MRRKKKIDFRKEPIQLVERKSRYPRLKPIMKKKGLNFRAVYLQMDRMRPEQFTHIIQGSVPEPQGFQDTLIKALAVIGIEATIKDLKPEYKKRHKKVIIEDYEIIEE